MKSSATAMTVLGAAMAFAALTQADSDNGWELVQAADFNSDGIDDVVWSDTNRNLFTVWLMDGANVRAPGAIIAGPTGDGWSIAAAGDFNQDGMADVFWSNKKTNRFTVWLMNGTEVLACGPEITWPEGWTLASSGVDFDADGNPDVLFTQDKTKLFSVWLMNGTTVLAQGPEQQGPVGDDWNLSTTDDFNHDGMVDIVWGNKRNNELEFWLMNGTEILAQGPSVLGPPPDSGWSGYPQTGDVNHDGMTDLIWTNDKKNQFTVWLMNGTSVLAQGPLIAGPEGDGWSVATSGEFNRDGMTDVMWQNKNPARMATWLMRGASFAIPGPVIEGPEAK